MKNFFFTLISLVLFTAVEGRAQGTTVSSASDWNTIVKYYADHKNSAANIATLQAAVTSAETDYENATTAVTNASTAATSAYNKYNSALQAMNAAYTSDDQKYQVKTEASSGEKLGAYENDLASQYYSAIKSKDYTNSSVVYYYVEKAADNDDDPDELYFAFENIGSIVGKTFKTATIGEIAEKTNADAVQSLGEGDMQCIVYFYYRSSKSDNTYSYEKYTLIEATYKAGLRNLLYSAKLTNALSALASGVVDGTATEKTYYNTGDDIRYTTDYAAALANVNSLLEEWNTATSAYDAAVQTQSEKKAVLDTAKEKLTAAQTADASFDGTTYSQIEITSSFTATSSLSAEYITKITGNGNTVTLSGFSQLLTNATSSLAVNGLGINGGVISNLSSTSARVSNYTNTYELKSGIYYVNTSSSFETSDNNSLSQIAYDLKSAFGMNLSSTAALVPVTKATKVYKVRYYSNTDYNGNYSEFFANCNGTVTGSSVPTRTGNEFFVLPESETYTGSTMTAANVLYYSNSAYTCANLQIYDGKSFYAPVAFTTTSLSYDRQFTNGWNSICLPFAVSCDKISGVTGKNFVEGFKDYDASTYTLSFSYSTSMSAHTPYLIYCGTANAQPFKNLSGTFTIEKTPNTNGYVYSDSRFNGILKPITCSTLIGNSEYRVFGMNKAGTNLVEGKGAAVFGSFRACVRIPVSAYNAKGLNLRFTDENGDLLEESSTTAIDGVQQNKFAVSGGEGVINVTTDSSMVVNVYSLNGKKVMSANVAEGTSSLDVQSGIYVVNGSKVIVK